MTRSELSALAQEHPGMVLLFRNCGDWIAYGEDAELFSRVLNLPEFFRVNAAGMPIFQLPCYLDAEDVIHRIIDSGRRVAILEQP